MTTALSFVSGRQITNDSGTVQSGAKLYFYRESTTTALTVWQDDGASSAHANPVVCDAGGFVPLVYIDDTYDYKVVIKTSADVTLKTYDNIPAPEATSTTGYFPELLTWVTKTNAQSPVALTASDAGNAYEADTTAGDVEFDLPSAATVGNGKGFTFKKIIAANSMIIDQSGTETIDDSATAVTVTNQYEVVHIVSNGAEWYIADRYIQDSFIGTNGGATRSMIGAANALVITNNAATPTTQIDVDADDSFLINSSGNGIRTGAVNLTIDATTTGANGLDTGALANTTWYYVFIISNGTTEAALLSTSATAPTMPSGYTYKYRVGAVRTGGAATFLRTLQRGAYVQYQVVTGSTTPNLPQIASGVSGDVAVPTWTEFSIANFVPPTAVIIRLSLFNWNGGATETKIVAPNNNYGSRSDTANPPPVSTINVASTNTAYVFEFIIETFNVYYASNGAGTRLSCVGWRDAVNAN